MSADLDTFKNRPLDPLINKQKHDVEEMRRILLSTNVSSPNSVKAAMNNILVMRVYHQIARIIRYTEQIDKIEAKLYDSIDHTLETSSVEDPRTWMLLLNIQEKLQKLMIDSHKILEPYLNLDNLTYVEVLPDESNDSFAKTLLDQQSREKLRSTAQTILAAIEETSSLETNDLAGDDDV